MPVEVYDADGDGDIDPIDELLIKYDRDGNGTYSRTEVITIVHDLEKANTAQKNMKKMIFLVSVAAMVAMGTFFSVVFAANESSKEQHMRDGLAETLAGDVVQVDQVKAYASLIYLPNLSSEALSHVGQANFAFRNSEGALREAHYQISGYWRYSSEHVELLTTACNTKIVVSGTSVYMMMSEKRYTIWTCHLRRLQEGEEGGHVKGTHSLKNFRRLDACGGMADAAMFVYPPGKGVNKADSALLTDNPGENIKAVAESI